MAIGNEEKVAFPRKVQSHLRNRFAAGFLVMIPIIITYVVLKFLFDFVEGSVNPLMPVIGGYDIGGIPGIGFLSVLVILYLVGLGAASVVGLRVLQFSNSVLSHIPIVRPVFLMAKQATDALSMSPEGRRYSRVVFLEWPRPGFRALGLVTGHLKDEEGRPLVAVYVPTVPNPTSGNLAILPEDQIIETDMTVEEAMKIVLSGGLLIPDRFQPTEVEEREGVEKMEKELY